MALLHFGYTYHQHGNLTTQDDYWGSLAEYSREPLKTISPLSAW